MFGELAALFPLGVASNSLLPLPFEPLLLGEATRYPGAASLLALWGSLCAATGEFIDVKLISAMRRRVTPPGKVPAFLRVRGGRFYVLSGLVAFSPIPITLVRAAAFWRRPRALPFAVAVGLGRLPRYLLIAWAWQTSGAGGWLTGLTG